MKSNRRKFLKTAGVATLAAGAASPVINALASSGGKVELHPNSKKLKAKRWGMVIIAEKLSEDVNDAVRETCHKTHNVPDFNHEPDEEKFGKVRPVNHKQELKWIWSEEFGHTFTEKEDEFLAEKFESLPFLVTCNHCKNPSCVQACPTKATFKRDDGIVIMDFHRCIGCRFCMAACPYGSRSFNFRDPRPFIEEIHPSFPTRCKGVVEKCNFCAERLAIGKEPACVGASEGAIVFGDLNDPESEVRALLKEHYSIRRKQGLGTEPSVYYIV